MIQALNIPDRTTISTLENRTREAGALALFEAVSEQIFKKGFVARGGQVIDATLVPAPKLKISRKEKEIIHEEVTHSDWRAVQRRQKDTHATWTKTHGKIYLGYKRSGESHETFEIFSIMISARLDPGALLGAV